MKKGSLIVIIILLAVFAFIGIQRNRYLPCKLPLILFVQSKNSQPEAIVNKLISELGGLPKTDIDVYEAQKLVGANKTLPVYPVNEWAIKTSSVTNGSFNTLFDDDPTYSHDFIIYVTYTDDDAAVLQWSSWSYGFVACPILISLGSGPPGHLKIVP